MNSLRRLFPVPAARPPSTFRSNSRKLRLVQGLDAQGARLFQFGAGVGAHHHVIGLLADGTHHAPAALFDHLFGLIARIGGQRAGQHELFSRQLALRLARLLLLKLQAGFA